MLNKKIYCQRKNVSQKAYEAYENIPTPRQISLGKNSLGRI